MKDLHKVAATVDKILQAAQSKLDSTNDQIALKQQELAQLEQVCENKKIASQIVELPQDMQREIFDKIMPHKNTKIIIQLEKRYNELYIYDFQLQYDEFLSIGLLREKNVMPVYRMTDHLKCLYNRYNRFQGSFYAEDYYLREFTFGINPTINENVLVLPQGLGVSILKLHEILCHYNVECDDKIMHIHTLNECTSVPINGIKYPRADKIIVVDLQ